MALSARKRLTKWLMHRLGRGRSLPEHAAAAGITVAQYAIARVTARPARRLVPPDVARWLKEIGGSGYCVVPEFFNIGICAQCVAELERLFAEFPDYVQRKSDSRLFGVEAASPLLGSFGEEPRLLLAAERMLRDATINAFTLGAQVACLLARDPSRLRTFTAKAGTLLLVNTSAIHRGQPIERGSRYALTNYYVQRNRAGAAMDAHFAPVLRKARVAQAAARPETLQSAR